MAGKQALEDKSSRQAVRQAGGRQEIQSTSRVPQVPGPAGERAVIHTAVQTPPCSPPMRFLRTPAAVVYTRLSVLFSLSSIALTADALLSRSGGHCMAVVTVIASDGTIWIVGFGRPDLGGRIWMARLVWWGLTGLEYHYLDVTIWEDLDDRIRMGTRCRECRP